MREQTEKRIANNEGTTMATEMGIVAVALLAYGGYHLVLWKRSNDRPLTTARGMNARGREAWVKQLMEGNATNDKKNILAVQSLRNAIMASSLLATLSLLLFSASAAIFSSAYSGAPARAGAVGALWGPGRGEAMEVLRFASAAACLGASLLLSCQSVSFLCHVNVLINVPPQQPFSLIDYAYVSRLFHVANTLLLVASRCLYLGGCLLLWIVGPLPVLLAALALLPVLYRLDFLSGTGASDGDRGIIRLKDGGIFRLA